MPITTHNHLILATRQTITRLGVAGVLGWSCLLPSPLAHGQVAQPNETATTANAQTTSRSADLLGESWPKVFRKDGTVDYVAMLNHHGQQIPNENNFAIDLANLLPPQEWPSEAYRQAFYAEWGLTPPNDAEQMLQAGLAETFSTWPDFVFDRPWQPDECPEAIACIQHHEALLKKLKLTMRGKRFHWPRMVDTSDAQQSLGGLDFVGMLMPDLNHKRMVARLLQIQALHQIALGEHAAAWDNILFLHHFSRQSTNLGTMPLIEHLVATSIDGIAINTLLCLLQEHDLSEALLDRIEAHLAQNQPLAIEPTWPIAEKWLMEDCWQDIVRGRLAFEYFIHVFNNNDDADNSRGQLTSRSFPQPVDFQTHGIDAEATYRDIDTVFRRAANAMSLPTHQQQNLAFEALIVSASQKSQTIWAHTNLANDVALAYTDPDKRITQRTLHHLASVVVAITLPDFKQINTAQWKIHTSSRLNHLALWLRNAYLQTGQWPPTLADAVADGLCPKAWIQDPFLPERTLGYRVVDGGFDLWSVGGDWDDDQGMDKETSQAQSNDPDDLGDWGIEFRLSDS